MALHIFIFSVRSPPPRRGNNYFFDLKRSLDNGSDLYPKRGLFVPRSLPRKRESAYLHFKKIADQIGASDARVHDLRHTYAVLSLQNGDDIKTVQTNLGHASAAFTLDVYGHVSDRMQRASADRMEEYIVNISRTKNA